MSYNPEGGATAPPFEDRMLIPAYILGRDGRCLGNLLISASCTNTLCLRACECSSQAILFLIMVISFLDKSKNGIYGSRADCNSDQDVI